MEQTNNEIKYLHEHIWEEYELTYQTALEFKNEEFEIKDAQQNISRLKKSINALGDVNPHAIEEYKEVSERFENEKAQCEDIEKGKADLIKIIEDLTTEMTTRFTDAFNEINENFKETFTALFGGGRAKLEIVENPNGNPLESGIEIYAQPRENACSTFRPIRAASKRLSQSLSCLRLSRCVRCRSACWTKSTPLWTTRTQGCLQSI